MPKNCFKPQAELHELGFGRFFLLNEVPPKVHFRPFPGRGH